MEQSRIGVQIKTISRNASRSSRTRLREWLLGSAVCSTCRENALGFFGAHRNTNTTTPEWYTMAEEQAAHHLLNVLEERGLDSGLDLDKVLATFEDHTTKSQAAEWVHEYLHEETLLTREELDL